jgi:hypothetical protein
MSQPDTTGTDLAAWLNRECLCQTLNRAMLERELAAAFEQAGVGAELLAARPWLFSPTAVFLSRRHAEQIRTLIAAIESVVGLDAFRQLVLDASPAIARPDPGPRGGLLGYDFHLTDTGPRLIEINTNPGGAFLNALLARAQRACCREMEPVVAQATANGPALEERLFETFLAEWERHANATRAAKPRAAAIVDDSPTEQYLYPEFVLVQRLFERHGIPALIADATELVHCHGGLWYAGQRLDFVYNRLTDFDLAEDRHAMLRAAYLGGRVTLTPHPHAYALYADKRNLAILTDATQLRAWGVPAETIRVLTEGIPRTRRVDPAQAEFLWAARRGLYFKPARGHGSKAVYSGGKLTRRVWEEILKNEYVAQAEVAPSERRLQHDGQTVSLKLDIRAYAYAGEVLLLAARLYRGQTTNFRTAGGGFAAVFVTDTMPAAQQAASPLSGS